jgi:hypothetical protein
MLKTPFRAGAVLAREGGKELFFLDAIGAWIWEGREAGMEVFELAEALAGRFDLSPSEALADVRRILEAPDARMGALADRLSAPVLSEVEGSALQQRGRAEPAFRVPPERGPEGETSWNLTVGGRSVSVSIVDAELAEAAEPLLAHLEALPVRSLPEHGIRMNGAAAAWSLWVDGRHVAAGRTAEHAAMHLMDALMAIAERPEERLLSLHAGGVVMPGGSGAVLVGAGGAGKTTLSAALNAEGFPLLSDDVVPVTPEGTLVGLGLCLTVKEGSWDVLESRFPELKAGGIVYRCDQATRYLPPRNPPVAGPVPLGLFLFPKFRPNAVSAMTAVPPEEILKRIAASNSVIPDLSQSRLDALVSWVSSAPGYSLVYPDLESGVALARECFDIAARNRAGRSESPVREMQGWTAPET